MAHNYNKNRKINNDRIGNGALSDVGPSSVGEMYVRSIKGSILLVVPAGLYFLQNVLAYVALQNIQAGVFDFWLNSRF